MPHYFTNSPSSYDFAYVTTAQTYPMKFEQRHPWRKIHVPEDRVVDFEHCKHLYAWYAVFIQGSPEAPQWLKRGLPEEALQPEVQSSLPVDPFADLKPVHGEERYVDYDDVTDSYGVFGTESGFCYSIHSSPEEAEGSAK